ncbi:hypothetical protein HII28_09670 [Planctomonas sp. JC2975]|uniref:hypothetical protein n=1 Tax=Planctomonas sp. JC2975 TaxID=2729626 RepID=UPI00147325D6|nr:hypothetical protein [Planctomonas sp. JC2975]NNC12142.1 hypothetical protein [Planctomonas sp. JC2975]
MTAPQRSWGATTYDTAMRAYWRPVLWVLAALGVLLILAVLIAKLIVLLIPIALIAILLFVVVPLEVRRRRDGSNHT